MAVVSRITMGRPATVRLAEAFKAPARRLAPVVEKYLFHFRRKWLYEAEVSSVRETVAAVPLSFRPGDAADVLRFTLVDHGYDEEDRRFSLERIAAGDWLFVGESGGQVVFYGWAMFGAIQLDDLEYAPIPPGVAYLYKFLTVPRYRGKGIMKAALTHMARRLAEARYSRALLWVRPRNAFSIDAAVGAGFHRAGTIYNLSVLGHRWSRIRWRSASQAA